MNWIILKGNSDQAKLNLLGSFGFDSMKTILAMGTSELDCNVG